MAATEFCALGILLFYIQITTALQPCPYHSNVDQKRFSPNILRALTNNNNAQNMNVPSLSNKNNILDSTNQQNQINRMANLVLSSQQRASQTPVSQFNSNGQISRNLPINLASLSLLNQNSPNYDCNSDSEARNQLQSLTSQFYQPTSGPSVRNFQNDPTQSIALSRNLNTNSVVPPCNSYSQSNIASSNVPLQVNGNQGGNNNQIPITLSINPVQFEPPTQTRQQQVVNQNREQDFYIQNSVAPAQLQNNFPVQNTQQYAQNQQIWLNNQNVAQGAPTYASPPAAIAQTYSVPSNPTPPVVIYPVTQRATPPYYVQQYRPPKSKNSSLKALLPLLFDLLKEDDYGCGCSRNCQCGCQNKNPHINTGYANQKSFSLPNQVQEELITSVQDEDNSSSDGAFRERKSSENEEISNSAEVSKEETDNIIDSEDE